MSTPFETLREPLTKRPLLRATSRAGVELWIAPMPGFAKTFGSATVRFGSLDTHLPDGTVLPDGIAHFLEHKMFQTRDGDVFDLYAARGASANAYTSFDHTTYLFTATRDFDANLDTLLETMADITTDLEGVERERGIIAQEIAMYDDDPSWRGYFNLLRALYRRHPIRVDIAGDRASIGRIDPALLRRVHAAYYAPTNLIVVVAGDVDPGAVLARVDRAFPRRAGRSNRRKAVDEPRSVAKREIRAALPISRPSVSLGLKDRPATGRRGRLRRHVVTTMALDVLCADGGRIQRALYDEGLVDDSFSAYYEIDRDYAYATFSADVDEVRPFQRRLLALLSRNGGAAFDPTEVERSRRRMIGRHLRNFNAPEEVAHWLTGVALDGNPPGAGIELLQCVTPRMLARRLRDLIDAPRAWSILTPSRRAS